MKNRGVEVKKASTHVGVILSFVIFVTFLVFLYTTLQPTIKSDKDKEIFLGVLKETLVNEISGELTTVSIKVNSYVPPANGNCISLNSEDVSNLGISGKNVIVKKINAGDERITPASLNSILKFESSSTDTSFKIYAAGEGITEQSSSCTPNLIIQDKDLSVRTTNYIFKSRVQKLKDDFEEDKEELKERLDLPPGTQFGFSFEDINGNTISSGETDVTASIYAEEISIQYVNETASINTGFLTLRVW